MTDFQQEPNTTQKLLAALSYISYFFLPIIFPLVVWIVGADRPFIKRHAKRAFWSQLIPMIFILVLLLAIGITGSFKTFINFMGLDDHCLSRNRRDCDADQLDLQLG